MGKQSFKAMFPQLEFETAAWLCHFWAEEISAEIDRDQHAYLAQKLGPLRQAITAEIGRGAIHEVPPEMISDEYDEQENE